MKNVDGIMNPVKKCKHQNCYYQTNVKGDMESHVKAKHKKQRTTYVSTEDGYRLGHEGRIVYKCDPTGVEDIFLMLNREGVIKLRQSDKYKIAITRRIDV